MNKTASSNAKSFPPADSSSIELLHPTNDERMKQLHINGASWRGALTLEAYLRREDHLANQDATRDGGLTSWALVSSADPATREVLCACESYHKKAIIASNGVVRDTVAHGIGSVFCPPDYRGNGYAGRMMKELGEKLRWWQSNEICLFSVLFSDIGKRYYAKYGWHPFPSSHVSIPWDINCPLLEKLPSVQALSACDLERLCIEDEASIRKSLKSYSASSDVTFVALIPDIQTIQWHHAREEFVGRELRGEPPHIKGAMVENQRGKRVWCYWTRMWYNEDPTKREDNTLHILRLVAEEKGILEWERSEVGGEEKQEYRLGIAALLVAAAEQAKAWGMEKVEIWNPTLITLEAARLVDATVERVDRDEESICSLRWYGDEKVESLVWLGNEKYGWC